jgi:protocatechuate 3,4-dioxygenase beta subunit
MATQRSTLVQGTVVDARGKPLAGARVGWVDGPVPLPDVMMLTDAGGRFTLAAPAPGPYRLRADSDRHGHAEVVVQAAGQPLVLTLQLPR